MREIIRPIARVGAYAGAAIFAATGAVTACTGGLVIGIAFLFLAVCIAYAVWDNKAKYMDFSALRPAGEALSGITKADWKGFKKTVDRTQR